MAFLNNNTMFIGSIGNLSSYKMRGSDKIIVRTKGGADKATIKKSPKFARTRENNSEFAGCAKMCKNIRQAIFPIAHLADFNFTPSITSIVKKIQVQDAAHKKGERAIYLSQYKYLLNGFSLNNNSSFDSVIRHSFNPLVDRDSCAVSMAIPALVPHINLNIAWAQPLYRLVFALGVVNDLEFGPQGFVQPYRIDNFTTSIYTPWHPVQQAQEAQELSLQLESPRPLAENESLFVSMGIEMGAPQTLSEIAHVKYCGAGKILVVR
jgi:hypothetical protein